MPEMKIWDDLTDNSGPGGSWWQIADRHKLVGECSLEFFELLFQAPFAVQLELLFQVPFAVQSELLFQVPFAVRSGLPFLNRQEQSIIPTLMPTRAVLYTATMFTKPGRIDTPAEII